MTLVTDRLTACHGYFGTSPISYIRRVMTWVHWYGCGRLPTTNQHRNCHLFRLIPYFTSGRKTSKSSIHTNRRNESADESSSDLESLSEVRMTGTSLSKDTYMIIFSWRRDHLFQRYEANVRILRIISDPDEGDFRTVTSPSSSIDTSLVNNFTKIQTSSFSCEVTNRRTNGDRATAE